MKVEVVRAWPHRFESVVVTLSPGALLRDAVLSAGMSADAEMVAYAIHGQRAEATTELEEGNRIEVLRPLQADPKDARRRRAQGGKRI